MRRDDAAGPEASESVTGAPSQPHGLTGLCRARQKLGSWPGRPGTMAPPPPAPASPEASHQCGYRKVPAA